MRDYRNVNIHKLDGFQGTRHRVDGRQGQDEWVANGWHSEIE